MNVPISLGNTDEALQLVGWGLTVVGQLLITSKRRAGFVAWMVSNVALIVLNLHAGLRWSAMMFATNLLCCIWSYWRWGDTRAPETRRLFANLARR